MTQQRYNPSPNPERERRVSAPEVRVIYLSRRGTIDKATLLADAAVSSMGIEPHVTTTTKEFTANTATIAPSIEHSTYTPTESSLYESPGNTTQESTDATYAELVKAAKEIAQSGPPRGERNV